MSKKPRLQKYQLFFENHQTSLFYNTLIKILKAFQIIFFIPIHFFSRYPPVIFVLPPIGIKSRVPQLVAPYSHIQ